MAEGMRISQINQNPRSNKLMTKSEVTKGPKYDEHYLTTREMLNAFSKGKKGKDNHQEEGTTNPRRKSLFE